jgi:hypothetical protein
MKSAAMVAIGLGLQHSDIGGAHHQIHSDFEARLKTIHFDIPTPNPSLKEGGF